MINSLLLLLGLAVGSFVNVVIARLPRDETLGGRSRCPHCSKTLKWYDLVPLVSYMILSGKCRYCSKKISIRYPLVELYSGIVFVLTFWTFANGSVFTWIVSFILLELFLILAVVDLKHLLLPDSIMIVALVVVVVHVFFNSTSKFYTIFNQGNLISGLVLAAVFYLIWFITGKNKLGFGDIKLVGVIGLLFGYPGSLVVVYTAIILGLIIGVALMIFWKATGKTKLPLGTFLSFSASMFILFGTWVFENFDVIGVIF